MITILSGTNDFARETRLNMLVAEFLAGIDEGAVDFALERLDAEEVSYERALEAVSSAGFLSPSKLVVIRNVSRNKVTSERISELLAAVADGTDVVISEGKLDKRLVYYKTLKATPGYEEYGDLDESATAAWLVAEAVQRGGVLSRGDASYLAGRVGFGQRLLSNELDKLMLYSSKINRHSIDLLTEPHPRSTIFELLETAFSGRVQLALKLYDEQRQLKVEPQAILALIGWQLHVLATVKAGGERTSSEIAKEAGLNPYVVSKSQALSRHLSMEKLKALISTALATDIRLKSEPIDADGALKNLILDIARAD